jgi:tetratricopeptide (TPR) repeat protein
LRPHRPELIAMVAIWLTACASARRQVREADALLEAGRYGAATRTYSKALERDAENTQALVGLAQARILDGDPRAAIAPAEAALRLHADGAEAVLADALIASGRGAEALQRLPPDTGLDPAWVGRRLEALLASANLPAAAELALGLDPASADAGTLAMAAWALSRIGRSGPAHDRASAAAALAMDDKAVQSLCAAVFDVVGDRARAGGAVSLARTARGSDPQQWLVAATVRQQGGDTEGAIRFLAMARALNTGDDRLTRDLGRMYLERGAAARAAPLLEAAAQSPTYAEPKSSSGMLSAPSPLSDGDRREALGAILNDLAVARGLLGDQAGAINAREEALLLRTASAGEWLAIADAWLSASQPARAAAAVDRALAKEPSLVPALVLRCRADALVGVADRAVGTCRAAFAAAPGNADVALILGSVHERRGEADQASRAYKEALQINPKDSRLIEALRRTER